MFSSGVSVGICVGGGGGGGGGGGVGRVILKCSSHCMRMN